MAFDGWITLGVTGMVAALLALNVAGPDIVLVFAVTALLALGVIDPAQALSGFSNSAVLTVAALFVVAHGLHRTGALDFGARRVLGRPGSVFLAQLRLTAPVALVSAFINNTPVVALMVPLVGDWAKRNDLAPSKLLIPLSYAAILGGTCTLIGTSTNLVVLGLAQEHDPDFHLGMFDLAWVGIPVTLVGLLFIFLFSRWLLPERGGGVRSLTDPREYSVAMQVEPGSPVVGKTIEEAELRSLPGLYLMEIERQGQTKVAVGPDERLEGGDVLFFTGVVESVVDLRKIRGLSPATNQVQKLAEATDRRRLVEAVVAAQSSLAGRTVRESRFRSNYNAAIIAVHRRGERIRKKIGDIALEAGDTLLIEAHPQFVSTHQNDGAFALVSEVRGSEAPRHDRAWIAVTILVGMVLANVLGFAPLLVSALASAVLMIATKCVSAQEARGALDLKVLVTIAAAFGLAHALDVSGAATFVAGSMVNAVSPFGTTGLLFGVFFVTTGFATLVGNNAAAALMFPVVVETATAASVDLMPLIFVLMVAASASFASPISYQTNLMVLGPGGYRFSDFFRIGVPLQILVAVVAVSVVSALF